jgi:hypothetical protein
MNTTLVHIGFHKTGTTWIQNELFVSNSDSFIPLSTKKKGHSSLANRFIFDDKGYLLNSFDNNEKAIRADLNELLGARDQEDENKVLVMSHERLSGNPHSSGFDSSIIARRIKKVFPNAKILIVIREQSSWILSNYFQYLSVGGTHSLYKYLNAKYDGRRPGFSPTHIEYHRSILDYQAKFGAKNVLVLPYELLVFDRTLFIKRIEAFIEKKIEIGGINFSKKYNVKRNHYLNYKLRSLNRFIHSSSLNNNTSLNKRFIRILVTKFIKLIGFFIPISFNESFKRKLSEKIVKWSHNRYDHSNKTTQENIEIDLEKFGYSMSEKDEYKNVQ